LAVFLLGIAKSRTKDAWELHAALRTVVENNCSTSNTTSASYDVTALAIIKPKHQRLADPLLQSGVATLVTIAFSVL